MKRNKKLVASILVISSVAAIIMATILTIIGILYTKTAYFDSFAEELRAAALLVEDEISHEWKGDWKLSEDGELMKGSYEIHDSYQIQLDGLHDSTGISYTIFYGDTRYITSMVDVATGKRMEGTKASDIVIEKVLRGGEEYLAANFDIGGKNWYAYYLPLMNSDGSVAGMVFAGRETDDVDAKLRNAGLTMVGILLLFIILSAVIGVILIKRSNRAINEIVRGLKQLEGGELIFRIDDDTFDRKDELGVIAQSSVELRDKLQDVIQTTMDLSDEVTKSGESLSASADTASQVADQVAGAVEGISKGAASQAESVESSLANTEEMGESIEDITARVDDLGKAAEEMLEGANRTVDALTQLMRQNESVSESMKEIDTQIRSTNDAVREIAEASGVITSIAEQTNLLSLNASIEAARAGEYGRGFSVVATEIGALAVQSKEAAVSIGKIVENLVDESQKSVGTIAKLNDAFDEQNNQLTDTKEDMDDVVENVNSVDLSAKAIAEKVHVLNELKKSFQEIISELSAISQQNAASSEETNASMEELNATFAVISNAASDLMTLAETLNAKMNFFHLQPVEE